MSTQPKFLSKLFTDRGAPRNLEFKAVNSDIFYVQFHHFAHGSYNSEGLMRYGIRTEKRDRYNWHRDLYISMSESIKLFFDVYLKQLNINLPDHFKNEKAKQGEEHYDYSIQLPE